MSYILEALRRAERERAQGQLPADASSAPPVQPVSRMPWLKLVFAVLALNALVLLVLLLRHKPQPDEPKVATVAAPATAPVARAPIAVPSAPVTSPAPAETDETADRDEEAVVQQGVSSMDDLGATGEADEAPPPPTPHVEHALPRGNVTFAKKPLTAAVKPPPPPDPEADAMVPDDAIDAPADDGSAEPQTEVASAAPASQPAAPSASLPVGTAVKPLSDMSAAYQASFPQLSMEVHVYDPAPQRRFAMIGGKRYREGEVLPQGPRLVQIVPEGLVLDYSNERVLYPIGRH